MCQLHHFKASFILLTTQGVFYLTNNKLKIVVSCDIITNLLYLAG